MGQGRAGIVGAWLAEHLRDYNRVSELAKFANEHRWEKWPFSEEVVRLQQLAQQGPAPNP